MLGKNENLVIKFSEIVSERKDKEKVFIDKIKALGYKALHPNDGWVDREKRIIHLVYPKFDSGCVVGDKIMIGWAGDIKSYRAIVLTEVYHSILDLSSKKSFYFEDTVIEKELLEMEEI